MSVVRIFQPENRLAGIIGGFESPTVGALTRDADTRLARMKEELRAYVAERHRLIAAIAEGPEEDVFSECKTIGDAARDICEVAGVAGLGPLGEAARGIYAMIDALVRHGVWHSEALKLHIDALALLNAEAAPTVEKASAMLAKLRAMREWVGVPE